MNQQESLFNSYNKVMETELGQYFEKYFNTEAITGSYKGLFTKIRTDIQNGTIENANELKNLISSNISEIRRDYGVENEFSLALLTIQGLFTEELDKLGKNQGISFSEKLDLFFNDFNAYLSVLPDSFDEYNQQTDQTPIILKANPHIEMTINDEIPMENKALYQKILDLKTDSDLSQLARIIHHYETNYAAATDVIHFNITKCGPLALSMIKRYILQTSNKE